MESDEKKKLFIAGLKKAGLCSGQGYRDAIEQSPTNIYLAEKKYDETRGMSLSSFIFQSGYWAGLAVRNENAKTWKMHDEAEAELEKIPVPFQDPFRSETFTDIFIQWGLTEKEKEAVSLMAEHQSFHKVGEIAGYSHETARQRIQSAQRKAKLAIEKKFSA